MSDDTTREHLRREGRGGCSCHISPPCEWCITPEACAECGEPVEDYDATLCPACQPGPEAVHEATHEPVPAPPDIQAPAWSPPPPPSPVRYRFRTDTDDPDPFRRRLRACATNIETGREVCSSWWHKDDGSAEEELFKLITLAGL